MPLIESQPDAVSALYARSLYELADSQGGHDKISEVLGELQQIADLARNDARFGEFLASRIVSVDQRAKAINTILAGRVSPLTLNFVQVLNEKARLSVLLAIVASLDELVNQKFGRVEIDVCTATPLSDAERDTLKAQMHSKLGREPVLICRTDAAMIGGIRLQIGDVLIDGSIEARLRKVREQMAANGLPAVRAAFDRLSSN